MAMDSENIKGRAYAFGTLSALQPFRRRSLQALLWCLRIAPDRDARALRFLHFAEWVLLPSDRVQRAASGEPCAAKKRAMLLFLSSFNGEWDEYLAAFSRVLALPLDTVWRHCQGWPGARHLGAFLDYVDAHELFADAFFNAYGDANAEDIRAALRLCEKLEQFALEQRGADATRFRQGYERMLIELGADLAA